MRDEEKTKAQLLDELETLRRRVIKLGAAETGREQAEEALRTAETTLYRLKKAVETTGVGITISDNDGNILYTNPADAEIHGYATEELIGQPSNIFTPPEHRDSTKQQHPEGKEFQNWKRERTNMRKNGSVFPAKLISNPIYDTQKFHIGHVTVCEDITERKQAEKALRRSLQLLEKIFAGLKEAVLVVEPTTRTIILGNPSIEHIFGYSTHDVFGQPVKFLYADQAVYERFNADLFDALDAQEVFYAECRMRRKDGNIFISEHTATEIVDDSGARTAVVMVVRDITERRQAEGELKKYHDRLEELVEERTAELTKTVTEIQHLNAQLHQEISARKQAEQQIRSSLQEKEVLLKEIHHRVKNNMQVISSLLNLQANLVQDKRFQFMFQESQYRIKSMALIHEKLYQSKNLTHIDFNDYVKTLAHNLYISYRTSVGNILFTIDVEPVSFDIDTAIPCGLIMNELVSNSLKYAFPGGSGTITIDMKEKSDGVYTLTIGDDGIGMPEDLDIAASDTLGLQLVKGLVEEQLEGTLELRNTQGTIWKITFQK
ncbi:MAG: PAS domain S-box protein [bacterium]|nr:PAS domain S-box protein [bacterium]